MTTFCFEEMQFDNQFGEPHTEMGGVKQNKYKNEGLTGIDFILNQHQPMTDTACVKALKKSHLVIKDLQSQVKTLRAENEGLKKTNNDLQGHMKIPQHPSFCDVVCQRAPDHRGESHVALVSLTKTFIQFLGERASILRFLAIVLDHVIHLSMNTSNGTEMTLNELLAPSISHVEKYPHRREAFAGKRYKRSHSKAQCQETSALRDLMGSLDDELHDIHESIETIGRQVKDETDRALKIALNLSRTPPLDSSDTVIRLASVLSSLKTLKANDVGTNPDALKHSFIHISCVAPNKTVAYHWESLLHSFMKLWGKLDDKNVQATKLRKTIHGRQRLS